jgi:phenylpyruvate tautomerase PptA (4-oxalocrotonate tautomerase family)
MPLVRISLLKGKSNDRIRAIADSVHQALTETFEVPPDDRFQFVDQYEPEEFIYDANYLASIVPRMLSSSIYWQATGGAPQPSSDFISV